MAPIIQVAIGLFFVFSLLALLVTQLNTFIANLLNWRAENLKEGLVKLVSDKELQAKILAHPLIRMVEANVPPSANLTIAQAEDIIEHVKTTKVTYIRPDTFVEALISLLSAQGGGTFFDKFEQVLDGLPDSDQKYKLREMLRDLQSFGNTDTSQLRSAILQLEDETAKQWLSYALEEAEAKLGHASVKSGQMIPLLEGIRRVKDQAFQDAARTILVTAQSLDEARTKLENWFDDGMGRTSELYRRKIGWVSLVVGFVMALVLNVDSLQLARSLWGDESLRQSVAAVAQQAAQQGTLGDTTQPQPSDPQQATAQSAAELQKTLSQLLELNLPIGWHFTNYTPEELQAAVAAGQPDPNNDSRNFWSLLPFPGSSNWFFNLFWKLVGLIVTAIAAAQGAPFWFDLLKRLTGGSQGGNPPATSMFLRRQ
ncbi:MAG: hypothetical protein R3E39_14185 [Anaerolineae bacterium]